MVSYELFARPLLRRMAGFGDAELARPEVPAAAEHDFRRRSDAKIHFDRVVATLHPDGHWSVRSAGGQGSHQLAGLAAANALAVIPDGGGVGAGDTMRVMLLAWG
jgi:molybdopterin biosynthesis enzyme